MAFLVFAHVNAGQQVFIIKEVFCERFRQFCFTNAGCAKEKKRANWSPFVRQTGAASPDRIRDGLHRFILANDPPVQLLFQVDEFFPFALQHPGNGDARPLTHNFGNVFSVHFLLYQQFAVRLHINKAVIVFTEAFLRFGNPAVANLSRLAEVAFAFGALSVLLELFNLAFYFLNAQHNFPFIFPAGAQRLAALFQIG